MDSDGGVRVRLGVALDADVVLELWGMAAEGASATDDRDGLLGLLAHDRGALLVAERDGVIVGTVIAAWDGWRGHCYRLAVRPEHRRAGVARALLTAADERLASLGARRVDALVVDGNEQAEQVWSAAGFRLQTGMRRWVK
jgi:ribosomal protein S18 acetylase RimI-like enzyme